MAPSSRWARLWAIARPRTNPMLRQGVWYMVVDGGNGDEVTLAVKDRTVRVPSRYVELREQRPDNFTVVYRGRNDPNPARGSRADLGQIYAVCPVSGTRVRVSGRPNQLVCPTCGHRGEIAWWETG